MHCAWLPLLKHFTNGINVLSTLVLRCANWERRGKQGDGEGRSWAAVESKQMALVLLSAWPSGVYLNWWLHHQTLAHQPTMALTTHIYTHTYRIQQQPQSECVMVKCLRRVYACVQCVCVCFYLAWIALQIHTNVFISTRPVKMSSLCLFSPHSEWHNTGLKDAIINLNVPWHFLTPLSTT